MPEVNIGWLTTAPHPTRQYSWDRGQRGWRLHAVLLPESELPTDGRGLVALCGLSPRRGWGLDLFIEDECGRCQAAMTRREAGGDRWSKIQRGSCELNHRREWRCTAK